MKSAMQWVVVCALCLVFTCAGLVEGQRRQFLQDVIQRIKSSPKHQSSSPSWFGERQFEVIGTGRLPLQSQRYHVLTDIRKTGSGDRQRGPHALARKDLDYLGRDKLVGEGPELEKIDRYETILIDSTKKNFPKTRHKSQAFPIFSKFDVGWKSKRRKKRSPVKNSFYHSMDNTSRRRPKKRLERFDSHNLGVERYDHGRGGFWDDEDFDGDLFGLRNVDYRNDRNVYKQQQGRGDRRQQETQVDNAKVRVRKVLTNF